jgi:hypothetical protein
LNTNRAGLRRGDHDDLLRVPRAEAGRSVPHAHRHRVARTSPAQIQGRIAQLTAALERCWQALAEGASNTGVKRASNTGIKRGKEA